MRIGTELTLDLERGREAACAESSILTSSAGSLTAAFQTKWRAGEGEGEGREGGEAGMREGEEGENSIPKSGNELRKGFPALRGIRKALAPLS